MAPEEPMQVPSPDTFLTGCEVVEPAAKPHVPRRRPKEKPKPGPPPKSWPPPQQDGKLHSLYSALQSALGEEVEPPPTQKACEVLRSMKHVGSRWKAQQQPSTKQAAQHQHAQTQQQQQLLPLLALPALPQQASGLDGHAHAHAQSHHAASVSASIKGKAKASEPLEIMHYSPPPIPLGNRAVHPVFLRELLRQGIPASCLAAGGPPRGSYASELNSGAVSGESSSMSGVSHAGPSNRASHHAHGGARWLPGNCSVAELIARCIRPAITAAHMSLVQSLVCGAVPVPWCPEGRFSGPEFEQEHLQGRPVFGPATYFVSFAFSYKFEEIVAAILHHYEGLPEVSSGGFVPVYYWISCFAVNINHGQDIRKNPESNFEVVLQRCRALLLATKPWSAPAALTRTWCLYECMVAVSAGVAMVALNLELDIPLDTIFADGGITHAIDAFAGALSELDVRRSHCASRMDHAYLMSMMDRHMGGAEQCNTALPLALRPCLMSALLTLVLKRPCKDYSLAIQLVEDGDAMLQWSPAFVAGPYAGGDLAAEFFGSALRSPDVRLIELVLDPCVLPLNPSGSQGIFLTRPGNLLLGQEAGAGGAGGGGRAGRRVTGVSGVRGSLPASRASTAVPKTPRLAAGEFTPSKVLSFAHAHSSLPTTPGAHTALLHSQPGSGSVAGTHERLWTGRTDRTELGGATRRSLNFAANPMHHAPEPEWSLGGWVSSATTEADPLASGNNNKTFHLAAVSAARASVLGPAALSADRRWGTMAGPSTGLGSSSAATPGAPTGAGAPATAGGDSAGGARKTVLPKSRVQMRQEEEARRAQVQPKIMTATGASSLGAALTMNPGGHLVTLALSNNALGSAGTAALVQALHFNYTLRTLLLRNNNLDAECGEALGHAIGRNSMLTCLDLGDNPLGPTPMPYIAQGLPSSGLRDLRLDMVGMDTDGVCAFAKGLSGCTALVRLDLSRNDIGNSGGWALASSLRTGRLQCLLLGHNKLGSAGVSALASSLVETGGRSLRLLDLRDNELGLESGASLADLLALSPPLACLDLSLNPLMGSIGVACLAKGLKENTTLCELRMTNLGMDASGVAALSAAMGAGAASLHRLDISDNPIGSEGAEALAGHALTSETCRLSELRLERCGLTATGRLALVSSMQGNPACVVRHLLLNGNSDPDADPKAGAKLVSERGPGGLVVASMSKAEQILAQALNIGRQLTLTRNVKIYG